MENKKPEVLMFGAVKIKKWQNEKITSYTIENAYKDDNDEWQNTNNYNRNDLMKLKVLINKILEEDIKKL